MSPRQRWISAGVGAVMGEVVAVACEWVGAPLWETVGMCAICGIAIGLDARRV